MTSTVSGKINRFFSGYPTQQARKGQLLILANEDPEHVYHLLEGEVREYSVSARGDEIVVNRFRAGSFFPMSWAINKTPNPHFFESITPLSYQAAPPKAVVAFIKENPDVMYDLLSRVYKGTSGILGRMVRLMGSTAEQRVLYELILQANRLGENRTKNGCFVKMNESELATHTGLSRETINREMRKLIAEDLVSASRQGILIKDLAKLQARLI